MKWKCSLPWACSCFALDLVSVFSWAVASVSNRLFVLLQLLVVSLYLFGKFVVLDRWYPAFLHIMNGGDYGSGAYIGQCRHDWYRLQKEALFDLDLGCAKFVSPLEYYETMGWGFDPTATIGCQLRADELEAMYGRRPKCAL